MADDRLTEIAARAAAATPGPWTIEQDYCDCSEYGCSHPPFAVAFGPFASFENTTDRHHYDAEFAARAREDVPWLLAQLKQAQRTDHEFDAVMQERDAYHEAADALAYAVAPIEVIGEHSSDSCPWTKARDLVTPAAEVDELRRQLEQARGIAAGLENENARLRAELERYVGKEPTRDEEAQYVSRCLDAVYDACEAARRDGRMVTVEEIEQAADGDRPTRRPARAEVLREAADEGLRWASCLTEGVIMAAFRDHLRHMADAAEKDAPAEIKPAVLPAEIHAFLARHLAEDVHLRYQQAVGSHAVEQAAKHLRMAAACQQAAGEITSPREYRAAADDIDPMKRGSGGPFPAELIRFGTTGGASDA